MTVGPEHLIIAPILIPFFAGALMLVYDERQRRAKQTISLAAAAARDASAAAAAPPGLGPGPPKSGTKLAFTLSGIKLSRMASCSCASSSSGTCRAGERLLGGLRAAARGEDRAEVQ